MTMQELFESKKFPIEMLIGEPVFAPSEYLGIVKSAKFDNDGNVIMKFENESVILSDTKHIFSGCEPEDEGMYIEKFIDYVFKLVKQKNAVIESDTHAAEIIRIKVRYARVTGETKLKLKFGPKTQISKYDFEQMEDTLKVIHCKYSSEFITKRTVAGSVEIIEESAKIDIDLS